jgi:hypothetical protein
MHASVSISGPCPDSDCQEKSQEGRVESSRHMVQTQVRKLDPEEMVQGMLI